MAPTSWWRGPVVLLAAQIALLVGSFAANVITARAIGPDGRGQVSLLLQLSYLLVVFVILGRDRAYPATAHGRTLLQALGDQWRLLATPFVLACVACAGFVLVFSSRLDLDWVDGLILLGMCLGVMLGRMTRAASIVTGRPRPFLWVSVLSQVFLIGGLCWLYAAGVSQARGWAAIYAVTGVVPYLAMVVVGRVRAPAGPKLVLRRTGIALPTIAEIMVMRLDRILLPILATYTDLGLYVAVASMAEITSWPAQQYADSRIPHWTRPEVSVSQCLREAWRVLLATVLIVAVGAVAITVLLVPLFGSAYSPGRHLIVPLSIAAVGVGFYRLTFSIGIAKGTAATNRVQAAVAVVLVIACYPWLIAEHAAVGAAWASVIALFGAGATPLFSARLGRRA